MRTPHAITCAPVISEEQYLRYVDYQESKLWVVVQGISEDRIGILGVFISCIVVPQPLLYTMHYLFISLIFTYIIILFFIYFSIVCLSLPFISILISFSL